MAYAMIYPEAEKGGRGKNVEARKAAETAGFSSRSLAYARQILRQFRKLADAVLQGTTSLDEALDTMKAEESRLNSAEAQLENLR